MNISKTIVDKIKDYVFKSDVEVCGNLRKPTISSNELILTNIKKGSITEYSPGKFRGTCEHEIITSIILHTHPLNSYAYPSVEDIIKVIKNHGRIVRSVIGCKWGIWDIKNTDASNIYSTTCKNILDDYIRYFLDRIGKYTKNTSSTDKSKDLNDNDMDIINESINRIEKILNVKINLYTWNEVENGLLLID